MEKLGKIYEGKAKILYNTEDPDFIIQYFKDDATAFNAQKRGSIKNKGVYNNGISTTIFRYLEENGIKTHFVDKLNDREMLVKRLNIFPVEVVMRNYIAGSLAQRFGTDEGKALDSPVLELYYKNDRLGDPMINEYHVIAFRLATFDEIDEIKRNTFRINELLVNFFSDRGIKLVDFKLEFGRHKGVVMLGDEITPDGCRLWDMKTNEKLDKDRFRRDLGRIEEAYKEVYGKVCDKEAL